MTGRSFLLILALLCALAAPARAQDENTNADAAYLSLVDAAVADPVHADWCGIRDKYADSSFYRADGGPADLARVPQMGKRMLMERSAESVAAFRVFSRQQFGSVNAHRYAAYLYKWHMELAHEKLETVLPDFGKGIDYIDFNLEKRAARELLKCIVSTGDGKSAKTAYHAITADEEIVLVEQYFRVAAQQATMRRDGDLIYSIIVAEIPNGPKVDVWFRLDPRMVQAIKDTLKK